MADKKPIKPKAEEKVAPKKAKVADSVDWKKVDELVASGVDQEDAITQARI